MRKLVLCLLLAPAVYADSAWIVYGPNGPVARTIVDAGGTQCPSITLNGVATAMQTHATPTTDYNVLVCELAIPSGTTSAVIGSITLPVAKLGRTQKVAIVGDTGCRRKKGSPPQNCAPPDWPFSTVANSIAAWEPDVILHVGDYYYREATSCTSTSCTGKVYNWTNWNADFFTPAQNLLPNAPWVMVRGNHEMCGRAAEGYVRFIDPRAYVWENDATCNSNLAPSAPYVANTGATGFAVIDVSNFDDTNDDSSEAQIFANQITGLPVGKGTWLTLHMPIWGVRSNDLVTDTLWDGWTKAGYDQNGGKYALAVGGHIHTLELLSFNSMPPQLVVGNGGTSLTSAPSSRPSSVGNRNLSYFLSYDNFGFIAATQTSSGWDLSIRDQNGTEKKSCAATTTVITCN